MKILQIIKGFVTNSSSANYWLNDEVLEEWENASTTNEYNKTTTTSKEVKSIDPREATLKQAVQEPVVDFSIWLAFSLILVLITIHRKIKK